MNTKKAIDYLLDERGVDLVLETYTGSGFVDCVCKIGGDTVIYRVREVDGEIMLSVR